MAKQLRYSADARKRIKRGIDMVADAVKTTLGPRGRNVIIDKGYGEPTVTNDGVTIAKEIELKDKFENLGAQLVKEAAKGSDKNAGDGTTTATVLTQALVRDGLRYVEAGINPAKLRRGMDDAKKAVIAELQKNAKAISGRKEVAQVATISAESAEMGEMIADVMEKVGANGVVTVEQGNTFGYTQEVVDGMNFDKGYISPYMITNTQDQTAEIKNPAILITDKKISTINEILPILEKLTQSGRKDLVIIAEDLDGEALATLIVNKLRGALNVLAVKAPEFGDTRKHVLEDIAVLTGGQVISTDKGMKLETAELSDLGSAAKVIATKKDTTIVDGGGDKGAIEARVAQLKLQADESDSDYDAEKLRKRAARLAGGVAVIRYGAASETEMTYIKHKLEDALAATKAAVEEGVVAGGGTALVKAAATVRKIFDSTKDSTNHEYNAGYEILLSAITEPLRQIVVNAGTKDAGVVLHDVTVSSGINYGYNAADDRYEDDMIACGIVDPLKVTRTALENAVSVASMLLTTEVAIVDEPEEKKDTAGAGMGGGMGGMM